MSKHETDSEKQEAAERPPERGTETAHRESMGAAVDHLERTRAQAAHQKDTENRPPKPTTNKFGRPEIVGDDGKSLVKGAEPSQTGGNRDLAKDSTKGDSHSAGAQAPHAQVQNPMGSFFAGRMDATADQAQKVVNAAQSGELSGDEAVSRLQNLSNEMSHLKDLKAESRTAASPATEEDSGASTPSKELMDAYGHRNPDDLWKDMGAIADRLDGMPAGPGKDAMARQYNEMNMVYQYLRSREQKN